MLFIEASNRVVDNSSPDYAQQNRDMLIMILHESLN